MLYEAPPLDDLELSVCAQIDALRSRHDRIPVQEWPHPLWAARLWRLMFVHATSAPQRGQASQDTCALALEACALATAEDAGYRRAMSLALHFSDDPSFAYSIDILKQLHHALLSHAPRKAPGLLRTTDISVRHERTGAIWYAAPPAAQLSTLLGELMAHLNERRDLPAVIRAAVAHLNCSCLHAFTDGNGRIARCLHTLVLARAGYLSPSFCSLDDYLGRSTQQYNDVMVSVSGGHWAPGRDTRPWVRFCLRGHLWQASLAAHAMAGLERLGARLEETLQTAGLPPRLLPLLLDAATGRPIVLSDAGDQRDACRLLGSLCLEDAVRADLLVSSGHGRTRTYAAADALTSMAREAAGSPPPLPEPFPSSSPHHVAPLAGRDGFWSNPS